MKTKLTLLLLVITLTAIAQPAILKVDKLDAVIQIAEDVPHTSVHKLVMDKNEYLPPIKSQSFAYSSEDDKYTFGLSFRKMSEGANRDLDIEGTTYYKFSSASGHFMDLFQFWKKYFDPKADPDKIMKDGYGMITIPDTSGGTDRIVFQKSSLDWMIIIRP